MAELTGRVFGGLRVLGPEPGLDGRWRCECGCGKQFVAEEEGLLSGRVHSCGCGRKRIHCGDITGMRSGRLVAIEPTNEKRRSSILWRCRCDCGREILTEPYKLRSGVIASCGCIRTEKKIKDLTNQKFGRLTALNRLDKKRGSSFLWHCRCECGNYLDTSANSLLSGNTRSCGCLRIEAVRRTNARYGSVAERMRLVDGTCIDRIERSRLQKNNSSGHTGVQARGNKWIAMLTFRKQVHYLGIYDTREEAIQARMDAEKQYFGEFLDEYYSTREKTD